MKVLGPRLLLILILLTGCQIDDKPEVEAASTADSVAIPVTAAASSTPPPAADQATPTLPPAPVELRPTATATPTTAPPRALVLAVPIPWHARISANIAEFNERSDAERNWTLALAEEPGASLRDGSADAAVIQDGSGFVISDEPIALTVPFTTDWEETSTAEGLRILEGGYPLVNVIKWPAITPQNKALRVDGLLPYQPGYPFREIWSLAAADEFTSEGRQLAAWLFEKLAPQPLVHAAAVGDIMLDRSLGYAVSQGDLEYPFAELMISLSSADITLGNLESALGDTGEPAAKHYTFRAPPQAADSLQTAGFDVLNLANNHALDYGKETLLQGISLLERVGIGIVGAGANSQAARRPLIREVKGLRIAFFGYVHVPVEVGGFDTQSWEASEDSAGLAWGRPEDIALDVAAVKEWADVIVVQLHSGIEYGSAPSAPQIEAAHAAIDAGADLVIGHHAHILQGIEFYGSGVIAYGLGNFAFQIVGDPSTAILNIWLDREGVRQLQIMPAIIQYGGQPRAASWQEAAEIRRSVYQLTNLLNPK